MNDKLNFKKLDYTVKKEDGTEELIKSEGVLPTRATPGDAGLDLYSTRITQEVDNSGKLVLLLFLLQQRICILLLLYQLFYRFQNQINHP